MRKTFLAITAATLALATAPAWAGSVAGTGGSTEITQIANNIQLVQQASAQLQQLQALQAQFTNLAQVGNITGVMSTIQQFQTTMNQVKGIQYSAQALNDQFSRTFPGYARTEQGQNASARLKEVGQLQMETYQSGLQNVGLAGKNSSQLEAEARRLVQMNNNPAASQNALVQTGNAIMGAQVSMAQQQLAVLTEGVRAQNTYYAAQAQKEADTAAWRKKAYAIAPLPTYKSYDAAFSSGAKPGKKGP